MTKATGPWSFAGSFVRLSHEPKHPQQVLPARLCQTAEPVVLQQGAEERLVVIGRLHASTRKAAQPPAVRRAESQEGRAFQRAIANLAPHGIVIHVPVFSHNMEPENLPTTLEPIDRPPASSRGIRGRVECNSTARARLTNDELERRCLSTRRLQLGDGSRPAPGTSRIFASREGERFRPSPEWILDTSQHDARPLVGLWF